MPKTPSDQRNVYRGEPARAWLRLELIAANGRVREVDVLVDTGNPCAIIIDMATMQSLRWRESVRTDSNFGPLEGGWLRIAIPELGFDVKTLRYANDSVVNVVKRSDPGFGGMTHLAMEASVAPQPRASQSLRTCDPSASKARQSLNS